jgi:2-desacetyl-2-hydroxyethyl bacteriochlorophyllide A dehydrogenase
MKAARFYEVGKPLKVESVNVPEIGLHDALVKVKACGVCHTDLHFIDEGIMKPVKVPQTMGHEAGGEIVKVGEAVRDFRVGDRVLIHLYFSCGECYYCQQGRESLCVGENFQQFGFTTDGGYAEFARAPARNLIRLPDEVPYEAGVLVDAGSTAYHAVREVGRVRIDEDIVIMGAGGVGLSTLQMAKLAGGRVAAVDVLSDKLKVANELGASKVINSSEENVIDGIMEFTRGKGADVIFEFVAKDETMAAAIKSLRRGGRLIFIGYSEDSFKVHPLDLIKGEIQVAGSRASSRRETVAVVELVRSGRFNLQRLITHSVSLDEVNQGLDLMRKGLAVRAVVKP